MNFDVLETASSREQRALEARVCDMLARDAELGAPAVLHRAQHVEYLQAGLKSLPGGFVSLEAARPWVLYWITHALALLEAPLPRDVTTADIADFLRACQRPDGGFGGSPGQIAHLAPTYAAVAAAVTAGGDALAAVDRGAMTRFLERRCVGAAAGGGFEVCEGGEVDVRGCYTAMAAAHMLCLDARALAERAGMVEYVRRCQTYEGGIGGEPGNEAHGGYTFCGLASLMLVGQARVLNLPSLLHFGVRCQGTVEGGFMGRTNKLVDGCYSFWQGGLFPLLQRLAPDIAAQQGLPWQPSRRAPEAPVPAHSWPPAAGPALVVPSLPLQPPAGLREQAAAAAARAQAAEQAGARSQAVAGAEALQEILEDCAATRCADGDAGGSQEGAGGGLPPLYNAAALRLWLLLCCQAPGGGLRDKPGKPPDYYHTCYCLSGLASAQHFGGLLPSTPPADRLAAADPLCNVAAPRLQQARQLFGASAAGEAG